MLSERQRVRQVWYSMIRRCTNPKDKAWPGYGGRGITVCIRWTGKEGFENFVVDMGPRPSRRYELDRYPNNDGNYEPDNCRWATKSQQNSNRRNNRRLTFDGRTQLLEQWACELNIPRETIASRLRSGWSIERALSTLRDIRWSNTHTKPRATRRAHLLNFHGKTKTIAEWARVMNLPAETISTRLRLKWSIFKTLSTPRST